MTLKRTQTRNGETSVHEVGFPRPGDWLSRWGNFETSSRLSHGGVSKSNCSDLLWITPVHLLLSRSYTSKSDPSRTRDGLITTL
ncbi:hypothetical protein [Scytonema sp. NUACC26]|uniref:hypothetical protein n=1 Tax=Scytonema sp. NUACC26 TaxID=3140176 RepID=UPI0038B32DDC